MSGKKYKIYQEKKFLGHWSANSLEGAMEKMLNSSYADVYNVDENGSFDVYYGREHIVKSEGE